MQIALKRTQKKIKFTVLNQNRKFLIMLILICLKNTRKPSNYSMKRPLKRSQFNPSSLKRTKPTPRWKESKMLMTLLTKGSRSLWTKKLVKLKNRMRLKACQTTPSHESRRHTTSWIYSTHPGRWWQAIWKLKKKFAHVANPCWPVAPA